MHSQEILTLNQYILFDASRTEDIKYRNFLLSIFKRTQYFTTRKEIELLLLEYVNKKRAFNSQFKEKNTHALQEISFGTRLIKLLKYHKVEFSY